MTASVTYIFRIISVGGIMIPFNYNRGDNSLYSAVDFSLHSWTLQKMLHLTWTQI